MAALARTLADLLAARASLDPDHAAIRSPGRAALGYGALEAHVAHVAAELRERGIGPRDRVALLLPNGPEAGTAFLAVASATTCAPLSPAYTEEELVFSFGDLGVKAVIAPGEGHPAAAAAARRLSVPVLSLHVPVDAPAGTFALEGGAAGPAVEPGPPPGPDDVALVLHTSGTTARPKIVPLTQRNLCASAANVGRSLALGPDDVCLNMMPLFHIHGLVAALLGSIAAGASVVCTPGFRAADLTAWLRDLAPTWYSAVPTIHQAVLQSLRGSDRASLAPRLRLVRSSSSPLPERVLRELEARFAVPVVEAYGMTEASHQMASNPLTGTRKVGSVGPAAGPDLAVIDERGRLLERGVGEIVVRGETVTAGYERNPEANAAAFVDGWLRTGDQGRIDEDGWVFLTGRLKELINRGGEKIAPREVEDALLRHPAVAQAVAFAAPHARLGEDVAAAVVLRDGATATHEEIRRAASEHLAPFKVPRRIEVVAEIPKGATGKVQRSRLAEQLGLGLARAGASSGAATEGADASSGSTPRGEAPRTETERRLAAIWARVLDLESGASIGREDDFFELGGDSLAAVEMLEAAAQVLAADVPIADFLERATIVGLIQLGARAADVADALGASGADLVPIRSGGDELPIFCTTLHDGSLWRVARLARHVPSGGPIYGFRPPPVGARGAVPTIEDLAERYLAALARVQPEGPVRLIGPCFGGTVALEMAIRLERGGREVELLAMVNSFNRAWRSASAGVPTVHPIALRTRHALDRLRFHAARLRDRSRAERIAYLRARAELARVHWADEARRFVFELSTASGLPRPRAAQRIAYASRHAQRRYAPRRYAGRVLLVRAVAPIAGVYPLPRLGWGEALTGDVETLDLPCEQLELWTDEKVLRTVALHIGEALRRGARSAA